VFPLILKNKSTIVKTFVDRAINSCYSSYIAANNQEQTMNQEQQVQKAIDAIRAIHQIYPSDVAALTAALSCKLASDLNKHLPLHEAAIDSLDNLSNYITDNTEETV
jgi:hypothetical protein